MTPYPREAAVNNIEADFHQLTRSAYLLTLDPGIALSVVMTAVDDSVEGEVAEADLLARTVELALQQLQVRPMSTSDRESSASEVFLYADHNSAASERIFSLKEDDADTPILSLQDSSRIAFVLHHVLDYEVKKAANILNADEKQFRVHLRHAYSQLISLHFGTHRIFGIGDSGRA